MMACNKIVLDKRGVLRYNVLMIFKEQAEWFLAHSQNRKRKPIKPRTVSIYRSYLQRHLYPTIGGLELKDVDNACLKALVTTLDASRLSASTINDVVSLVKMVVSSAVDSQGNEMFPRTWNNEFIDLPEKEEPKAPVATREAIQQALGTTKYQDKALIALIAGTGLRMGEALALRREDWDDRKMTISVHSTVSDGDVSDTTKTEAGTRVVDLAYSLNAFLLGTVGERKGYIFGTYDGHSIIAPKTAYRHLSDSIPGYHSLRRFRITHLRNAGVPEKLIQTWVGHADKSITDRYDKVADNEEMRREWAKTTGLGFDLETMENL